jgi:hypothetical protein
VRLIIRNEAWPIAVEWLESAGEQSGSLAADLADSEPPPSPTPSDGGGWPDEIVVEETSQPAVIRSSQVHVVTRRQKTTSECTESSISQTMLELGPSPIEPSFQLPGEHNAIQEDRCWLDLQKKEV